MRREFSILLVALVLLIAPAFSVNEPSQQSNKIYYAPYYVASMSQNVNTTFNLPINPPDGISSVRSAVINFQVYAAPTITFTLYANNKSCTPASFSISTTYATAGLLSFAFDCSNVIKTSGNYTLKLSPSKNTGAAYGWMDFVYVNRPNAQMQVKGTEYFAGDRGTVFLQLVDAYGQPITDAACFNDIYYPSSYNTNHTPFVEDVPMLYKEEGLYYYDFIVPPYTGVYMVLANCRYGHTNRYWLGDTLNFPTYYPLVGTPVGDEQVLNSYTDGLYLKHPSAMSANVSFSNITAANTTLLSIQSFLETSLSSGTIWTHIWNYTGNKWVRIGTFTTGASGGTTPSGIDEYFGYTLPYSSDYLSGGKVWLKFNSSGAGTVLWNAIWLSFYNFDSQYVPIYGSGELHISSEGDVPLIVSTLCGDATSDCALFYENFTNYPYPEGSIYDNVTVFSQETGEFEWTYETPSEVDCTAFNRILFRNSTNASWDELDFTGFNQKTTPEKDCVMQVPLNATRGQTYYYYLDYGNYMRYTVLDDWRTIIRLNSSISSICFPLAEANNWTYIAPVLNNLTLPSGNSEPNVTLALCSRLFDQIYWASEYYDSSVSVADAGNYQQYLSELEYNYEKIFTGSLSLLNLASLNNLTNFNTSVAVNANLTQILTDIASTNHTIHSAMGANFTQVTTGQSQILANISSVNTTLLAVNSSLYGQGGVILNAVYAVQSDVQNTNSTLHSSIQTVSTKLDLLASALNFMNSTIHSALVGNFTQLFTSLFDLNTAIEGNFTNTNALIVSVNNTPNITVNLTPVLNDIASLNTSLSNQILQVGTEVTIANTSLHSALESNFTQTNSLIVSVNNTPNITIDLNPVLSAINSTNETLHGAIASNATATNNLIISVNNTPTITVDLTSVIGAIDVANTSIHSALAQNTSAILNSTATVASEIQNTNSTLHTAIGDNATYTNALIISVNNTPANVNLTPVIDAVSSTNTSLHSAIASNATETNNLIISVNNTPNISVNFTPVLNAIATVTSDVGSTNSSLHQAIGDNASYTNSLIISVNNTPNVTIDLTPVLTAINNSNASLTNEIVSGNAGVVQVIVNVYDAVNSTNDTLHSALAQNTSAVLSAVSGVSAEVQNTNSTLVNLLNGIASYFDGLFTLNSANMQGNFTYTNNLISSQNLTCGNVTVNSSTPGQIASAVWNNPIRTLTEWNTIIPAIWDSNKNSCKAQTPSPSETVGNTPAEPAVYKVGNTESGDQCGVGCRITGFVSGIFGGG